ncbi:helix-turn-helix domain-containing protein [Paenibacillus tarimensis]
MEPIHIIVGRNMQAIRKQRGLSLDKVSELTGVSKAMLGQIERGDTNPTVGVLWKIVNGLHISFTSLIDTDRQGVTVASPKESEPFTEQSGLYKAYPIFPFNPETRFEMFLVELEPGCVHTSEPHNKVNEYILVWEGHLTVTIADVQYTLRAGEAISFKADCPHTYHNGSDRPVRCHTVIFYGA